MPKIDRASFDPREAASLFGEVTRTRKGKGQAPTPRAVPKKNLELIARDRFGSHGKLAEALSTPTRRIGRQTVSEWISGRAHMSDADVIHAAHVLDISPLAVLDLCPINSNEAMGAEETREYIAQTVRSLREQENGGPAPALKAIGLPQASAQLIVLMRGDHRDLRALAIEAAKYYAANAKDIGDVLRAIMETGRAATR